MNGEMVTGRFFVFSSGAHFTRRAHACTVCAAVPLLMAASHEVVVILWDVGATFVGRADSTTEEAKQVPHDRPRPCTSWQSVILFKSE